MLDFETRAFLSDAAATARDFAREHRQSLTECSLACAAVLIISGGIYSLLPAIEPASQCTAEYLPLSQTMPAAEPAREWTWPIADQQADEPSVDEEDTTPRRRRRHGRRG